MNCNTTHYRANSSSVPGDPTLYRNVVAWYFFEVAAIWFILGAHTLVLLWLKIRRTKAWWARVLPRFVAAAILLSCSHTIPLALSRQWQYVRTFNEPGHIVAAQVGTAPAAVLIDESVWPELRLVLQGQNEPALGNRLIYADGRDRDWTLEQLQTLIGPRALYRLYYIQGADRPLLAVPIASDDKLAASRPAGGTS